MVFRSLIMNCRQRGQRLISCCLQSHEAHRENHGSKWQVLLIVWVNSPLLCSIALTLAIRPFLPLHSKPQRLTIQTTSVSCFIHCDCTFPRGTLIWDLVATIFFTSGVYLALLHCTAHWKWRNNQKELKWLFCYLEEFAPYSFSCTVVKSK